MSIFIKEENNMSNIYLDTDGIKNVIPHREPMLMIDKVLEMEEGKRIRASLYLNPEFDYFRGHFPGEPVMPGVLTVESMAQTADVLLLSMPKYAGKIPLFIGIDEVKFMRKICPEDTIEIEAEIYKENEPKAVVTCKATVYNGDVVTTTGLVTLAMR